MRSYKHKRLGRVAERTPDDSSFMVRDEDLMMKQKLRSELVLKSDDREEYHVHKVTNEELLNCVRLQDDTGIPSPYYIREKIDNLLRIKGILVHKDDWDENTL